MPVRRLRALATAIAGVVVAAGLSVYASAPALALDPPANPSPSGAQTGIPTFSWDRVDGATTYDFQISASDQFATTLVSVTTVQHQYVPNKVLPTGTQLYWRVRATGAGEVWTTTPFSLNTVGAPTLIGPADGAQLTQPDSPVTLSWQPVAGATSYDVQYGVDPNFVDQITTTNVKTSSFVLPLQAPGTYVWRVRGVLATGIYTAWSGGASPLPPARSYQVMGLANSSSVPPTSPPDDPNQALTDVVLDWEPIKGAKSYQLQISTDQLFPSNNRTDVGTIYGTRYSPPKTLDNDQYFWRVRPTDAAGFQPDWSSRPVWRFKRTWPDQPTLKWPQQGSTVTNPLYFQWSPVKHASLYVVQIAPAGGGLPTPASFSGTCTTTHTTLVYGEASGNCWPSTPGLYTWRVTAKDEFSSSQPITDGIAAPVATFTYAPPAVTTTGPASGTHFSNTYGDVVALGGPTLSWNPVAGAEKYKVTITGTSTRTITTDALSYAPRYLDAGTYHWDVQTVDALGAVGAATPLNQQRSFTVDPPPMVPDPDDPTKLILKPIPAVLPPTVAPDPLSADLGGSYRFPALKWHPSTWVDTYTVYITRPGGVPTALPDDFSWNAGDDTRGTYLDPGTYSWYVVETRVDGTTIEGSTSQFTILPLPDIPAESYQAALSGNALTGHAGTPVDTCNLKLPSNCQNLRGTPVLGWDKPNDDVGYYQVLFSNDAELTNIISGPFEQASTMFLDRDALPDSQAGSAYFVVILPCTADGHCASLTHSTHSFNKLTRPATLVSPADGAQVQNDVTLTWDDYLDSEKVVDGADPDLSSPLDTPGEDEAEYYNVQTASDQNFTQSVTTTKVDQTTFTSFSDTYPEGTTWWRVQAVDHNGNTLAWSAPRSFLKQSPTPQLLLPADGDTVPGDYTLSWAAQPYAASYDVEVYKGGDTSGNTVNRVISTNTDRVQYVLTNLDPGAGPYAWRVRRHDGKNRPGGWSAFQTFNVSRPGVTLISPADNDGAVPPSDQLFQWQPVQGATSYKFERRPGTSGSATESTSTPTTKWAPTAAIAGGSWQWRVTAYDPAGNLIADSSWLHPFSVTDTPVATVPVSISGLSSVGSTLTLNPAQWNMPNNVLTITYQWYRGSTAIAGETGPTYVVAVADQGKAITVRATATRPGYKTGTSTSNAVTGAQAGAPLPTEPVTISGTGLWGSTLTLTAPTWDSTGVTTTYQWFRDTSAISGATGTSYVVGTSDMGKDISVQATGKKSGFADGLSVSTSIVGALNPAPVDTTPITLTGAGTVGSVLTRSTPVWDTPGVTVSYQWYRDATPFTNSPATYTVAVGDVGKTISVVATATKTGWASGTSTSDGITAALNPAPEATTPIELTGPGTVGSVLTRNTPVWDTPGVTVTYQWYRDATPFTNSPATYTVTAGDVGKTISVVATATKSGWVNGTSTSDGVVAAVAPTLGVTTPTGLTGSGAVGSVLTLSPPVWDTEGVTTSYQWFRDATSFSNAGTTYTVLSSDIGKTITVKATGSKALYTGNSSTSNGILATQAEAPQATTPITLTGAGTVGSVLTRNTPVWDTAGVSVSYQWFRDATPFTNNPATYTVTSADIGKTITVRATATKAGYVNGTSTSDGVLATPAPAVTPTTAPSITGVPAAKETLTANVGVWPGTASKSYAYQWFVDGQAVAKATGKTYVVRTLDAGQPVSVRITMTMNGTPSTASSSEVQVAKLTSTTTATLAAKKITQKDRGVLSVKVAMLGYDASLGQIEVRDGSKVIARVALATGKNGVVTVRLKKLKLGKHKLTVTYLGSVATDSSAAKRVTLKVVKAPKKK